MTVTVQNFGQKFISGAFEEIYDACDISFQQLVTLEQFSEMGQQYNAGIESYEVYVQNEFLGMRQTVWLCNHEQRAIFVAFQGDSIVSIYLFKTITNLSNNRQGIYKK